MDVGNDSASDNDNNDTDNNTAIDYTANNETPAAASNSSYNSNFCLETAYFIHRI